MDTDIKILDSKAVAEFKELVSVFEDVFEMANFKAPPDRHLQNLLNSDAFFAVVASAEGRIIGGLTVYVLHQYYSEKPLAYIFDLAVLTKYQRKGVGKKLMECTIEYCREKGFEEVFVQADKVDDYAIDFYRSTKPTIGEEGVVFSYVLKRN